MHYIHYQERKTHGTSNFPVGFYHVSRLHPQYAMPYHWHEELELIRILQGCFEVMADDSARRLSEGDILVVNSGSLHGGSPQDCVYECLVFPPSFLLLKNHLSPFLTALNSGQIRLEEFFPAGSSSEIPEAVHRLFQAAKDTRKNNELTILGLLLQTIGLFHGENRWRETPQPGRSDRSSVSLLKNVLNYIDSHYSKKITLESLARIAGMSPKYFCHFFWEMTGRTPIDYVNYYRIERACYLLAGTDCSITSAALSCGFRDPSYFIKIFRKYKGQSPLQYLKNPLEKNPD